MNPSVSLVSSTCLQFFLVLFLEAIKSSFQSCEHRLAMPSQHNALFLCLCVWQHPACGSLFSFVTRTSFSTLSCISSIVLKVTFLRCGQRRPTRHNVVCRGCQTFERSHVKRRKACSNQVVKRRFVKGLWGKRKGSERSRSRARSNYHTPLPATLVLVLLRLQKCCRGLQ